MKGRRRGVELRAKRRARRAETRVEPRGRFLRLSPRLGEEIRSLGLPLDPEGGGEVPGLGEVGVDLVGVFLEPLPERGRQGLRVGAPCREKGPGLYLPLGFEAFDQAFRFRDFSTEGGARRVEALLKRGDRPAELGVDGGGRFVEPRAQLRRAFPETGLEGRAPGLEVFAQRLALAAEFFAKRVARGIEAVAKGRAGGIEAVAELGGRILGHRPSLGQELLGLGLPFGLEALYERLGLVAFSFARAPSWANLSSMSSLRREALASVPSLSLEKASVLELLRLEPGLLHAALELPLDRGLARLNPFRARLGIGLRPIGRLTRIRATRLPTSARISALKRRRAEAESFAKPSFSPGSSR